MNLYKAANKNNRNVLLLSKSKEKTKAEVLQEVSIHEQNGEPCCVVTYEEYCDYENGAIERNSDLYPFGNMDIKSFNISQDFLTGFIACIIELDYEKQLNVSELEILRKICSEVDFSSDEVPLYQVLKLVQDKTHFSDIMTRFARKIDCTVETIKNGNVFYCECPDPTILFVDLIHAILSIKSLNLDFPVSVYTNIFDYISDANTLNFLKFFMHWVENEKICKCHFIASSPSISFIKDYKITSIRILDSIDDYTQLRKSLHIWPWRWTMSRNITIRNKYK